MQFTLKTLLVLFVVLASSVAAFGPAGIVVTFLCVVIGVGFCVKRPGCTVACVVTMLVGIALLLPAISAIRESARRAQCLNNLRQLGWALHNYHDQFGSFPPAYVIDTQGRRMHSWRTLLLPCIEQRALYSACHFDEPWDAPSNQALAGPAHAFGCSSTKDCDGRHTCYVAVTGPGTAWPCERGAKLDDFTDGPSTTVLLVELADSGIAWAEPRDVTFDEAIGPPSGQTTVPRSNHFSQGSYFLRGMPIAGHVLMADCSVREVPGRLSGEDLAALLTIRGGEKIDLDALLRRYEPPLVESLRWDHVVGLPLFLVSVVWFWLRLAADAKVAGRSDEQQAA